MQQLTAAYVFPTGFMTPEERKVFDNIRSPHLKYWIPFVWFSNLAAKARQEGRIQDSIDLQNILNVTFYILFYINFICKLMFGTKQVIIGNKSLKT